jgi:hypothetical protein
MKSLSTIRVELAALIAAIGEVLGIADVLPIVAERRRKVKITRDTQP